MKVLISSILVIVTLKFYLWGSIGYPIIIPGELTERLEERVGSPLRNQLIHGVDKNLVNAIIQVESSGNPNAVSSANCLGLMQVNPKYWLEECNLTNKQQLFIPEKNIKCGTTIFKHYLKRNDNNLFQSLRGYNCGYTGAKRNKNCGVKYAKSVLNLYSKS